jgi:hypothetical protein
MAVQHGSKAVLKLHDGTSLRDLSAYVTQTGMNRQRDLAETTPIGGSTYKTYITGLRDGTFPLEGNYDVVVDGYLSTMYDNDASAAFEYYPMGNTSGSTKYVGTFVLTSFEVSTGSGDKGTISAEAQITGPVTRSLVP